MDPSGRLDPTRRGFLGRTAAGFALGCGLAPLDRARASFAQGLAAAQDPGATRADYTLDPKVAYFNHASIGTIPRLVQQARNRYLEVCESNPWLYMWGGAWDEAREETRQKAATLLGCAPSEVALTHNTTEGFNALAAGLALEDGDEVLFSSLNHAGASICWHHFAAERGYTVRQFEFPLDRVAEMSVADVVALHEAAIGERTRVLVLPHIDNMVGLRHPVQQIAQAARAKGVEYVACDGAQSLGMIPVDVQALGVDFYCASPHKWVQAPKGTGLFYVKAARRPALRPSWVTWGQERWQGTARIFEDYGTRNLPEVLALGDAIVFQQERDIARTERRLMELRRQFRRAVADTPRLSWRSPADDRLGTSVYAVHVEGKPSAEVQDILWQRHGFVVRAFGGALDSIRISPNVFATSDEVERLFDVIRKEIVG